MMIFARFQEISQILFPLVATDKSIHDRVGA
jgi:hypothetical protein